MSTSKLTLSFLPALTGANPLPTSCLLVEREEKHIEPEGRHRGEAVIATQSGHYECTRQQLDAALLQLGYRRMPAWGGVERRHVQLPLEAITQLRAMRVKQAKLRERKAVGEHQVEAGRVLTLEWISSQLDKMEAEGGKLVHMFQAHAYSELGSFISFFVTDAELDLPPM